MPLFDSIPCPAPCDDVDARLTNLEIKASFMEDVIDKLDSIVISQQQQIDQLARVVADLRQPVRDQDNAPARNARDDLPPHY